MPRKKAGVKRHKRIRKSCMWCGITHRKGAHRFHGKGSYARTHKKKRGKRRRR